MSFTTGTLLYHESITIAELYGEMGDWIAVRDKVVDENLLQMRTLNASKRVCSEVISRLKKLTPTQLEILREGSLAEQNFLLWLAICKRYRFIYDFAAEVIWEKHLRLDLDLSYDDYDLFFNDKAEWHPEVANVTVETRMKGRQVIFKILREAELLTNQKRLIPVLLTPSLIEAIQQDDNAYFAVFPATDVI